MAGLDKLTEIVNNRGDEKDDAELRVLVVLDQLEDLTRDITNTCDNLETQLDIITTQCDDIKERLEEINGELSRSYMGRVVHAVGDGMLCITNGVYKASTSLWYKMFPKPEPEKYDLSYRGFGKVSKQK